MLWGTGPSTCPTKLSIQILAPPKQSALTSCLTSKFLSDKILREAAPRTVFQDANKALFRWHRLQITASDGEFKLPGETLLLHLFLDSDFTVKVLNGPEGAQTGETGNWTIVYD